MTDDPLRFLTPDELRARGGAKWNTFAPDVLPLWIAEMDFPIAAPIRHALTQAIETSAVGYSPLESASLVDAFTGYVARHYGQVIDPGAVKVTGDVLRSVAIALRLSAPAGTTLVVPTPSYPQLLQLPAHLGYRVAEVPLRADAGFALDLDAIEAQLAAGARTVLLIQPHNPTGRRFERAELEALARLVTRYGARVIADEVHAPINYRDHVAYSTIPGAAEHTFTATSPAKGWTFPGLKCAFLIAHNERDAAALRTLSPFDWQGASALGILGADVAYREGEPWRAQTVDFLARQGLWLEQQLHQRLPELAWRRPDATYFAWLDLRPFGISDHAAAPLLDAGLAVNEGAEFGAVGRGWVRLNYATTPDILSDAVARLEAALRGRA